MSEKASFWQTFPGVLAAIATILTAGAAIISFATGMWDADESSPEASPSPTELADPARPGQSSGSGELSRPVAVIAPRTLDFGRLGIGRSSQMSVTVVNSGTEFLVVDEAELTGRSGMYSVDAEDCLSETSGIEPRSECEITVTFNPSAAGAYAGFLEIRHSAEGSPTQVALSGEGALLGL